jgi:hypothetical protein
MKKLSLAFILFATTSMFWASCNNGDYNASPETNGMILGLPGALTGNFNGTNMKFTPATWQSGDNDQNRNIYGALYGVQGYYAEVVTINMLNYTGPKGYAYNAGSADGAIIINFLDQEQNTAVSYSTLGGDGRAQVNITTDAKRIMLGNFSATLYKVYPSLDVNDKIEITNGTIAVEKHQ